MPTRTDFGNVFEGQLTKRDGSPLSLAGRTVTIILRPPSPGEAIEVTATVTDAADGRFEYVAADELLDTAGDWSWQPRADADDETSRLHGRPPSRFTVHRQ